MIQALLVFQDVAASIVHSESLPLPEERININIIQFHPQTCHTMYQQPGMGMRLVYY